MKAKQNGSMSWVLMAGAGAVVAYLAWRALKPAQIEGASASQSEPRAYTPYAPAPAVAWVPEQAPASPLAPTVLDQPAPSAAEQVVQTSAPYTPAPSTVPAPSPSQPMMARPGAEVFVPSKSATPSPSVSSTVSKPAAPLPLAGKSFYFDGFTDGLLAKQLQAAGGKMAFTVTKDLSFLVVKNTLTARKIQRANELGVRVITFLQAKQKANV